MKQAVDSGQVEATLRALAPQHPQYERLRQTLQRILAQHDVAAVDDVVHVHVQRIDELQSRIVAYGQREICILE